MFQQLELSLPTTVLDSWKADTAHGMPMKMGQGGKQVQILSSRLEVFRKSMTCENSVSLHRRWPQCGKHCGNLDIYLQFECVRYPITVVVPMKLQLAADKEPGFDAELAATIADRFDDLESGRVQGLDYDAFMARMQAKIDAWQG